MRKRTGVVAFLAALAVCHSPVPAGQGSGGKAIKVMSWNILYSFNHKKATKQGIAWIKSHDVDVLALQELNGNSAASFQAMATQWGHGHSAILKERGFPVGLTSKRPIEVLERRVKGFHHGYLHCKTYGVHFFVVHFWPSKPQESRVVLDKARALLERKERVIILGDFNSHSRRDDAYLKGKLPVPLYGVLDSCEAAAFVDIVHKHDKDALYSFGTPILIPRWAKTMDDVDAKRQRIDFILADKALSASSVWGTVLRSDTLDKISDHYPVAAAFELP